MQIVRYVSGSRVCIGVVRDQQVFEVDWELRDLLVLAAARQLDTVQLSSSPVPLAEVDLLPPVDPTARIFCAGINYAKHQAESADVFAAEIPTVPIVFMKSHSALCGATSDLVLSPSISTQFDWEAELGVLIGAPARDVPASEAWNVVAGFTVVNDISARDIQVAHVQWTLGKNTERATPVGPAVTTIDEAGPDTEFFVELEVNGVLKQSASTRDMIFDVPQLIATISRAVPLLPGDLIATGTPSGVGFKRQPPEYLSEGDIVVTRIRGLGALENRIRLSHAVTRTVMESSV